MPRLPSAVSLVVPLSLATLASSQVECRWAETPPVIDGRADEAGWQRAALVDNFRQNWISGAPAARQGARVRLLWDREALYFFAELDDQDVTATVSEHDGKMWENDVFEIFLKPSEQHAGYYEFEFNPLGAVLDAVFPTAESARDPEQLKRGAFRLESKVTVRGTLNASADRDAGWSVEGRIPWTDLGPTGGRPAPGETWRLNLARVDGAAPNSELSSAAPLTRPGFHRTAEYATLRFIGPEPIARIPWQNTRLLGSPDGPQGFRAVRAWPRLDARSMVAVAPAPDGEWLWYVEQEGGREGLTRLRRTAARGDGSEAETLLEPEDLVYNLAFHPRFAENGFVYLGVNGPTATRPRSSRITRYTVRDGRPDPASRVVIIEWPSDGHNGAALAFGGDGRLFVTSGDGTSHSDTDRVGQDLRTLRSKILRIDVDRPAEGKRYSVPPDNPFVADSRFAPETWAYGLRNPWRLTYDAASGQLWTGENGQDQWEYARLVRRGENYGWSVYEGAHVFAQARPLGPHPVTFPTVEFSHAEFRSLSGGVVYRGRQFPELAGAYVFGDFGTGRIWAAKHDGARLEWMREIIDTPFSVTHVTADADGELLVADYGVERFRGFGPAGGGAIHRIERALPSREPPAPFPRRLSETGLFADTASLAPADGVLPYDINVPGWHDGATSQHLIALPRDTVIHYRPGKSWDLPDGTVLVQTLVHEGRRIETRLLVKLQNDFAGYSYAWNAAQNDAELAEKAGAELNLSGGRSWRIPSRAECMMCHSRQANFSLTVHEWQLNRGDQLARWERMGVLRAEPSSFGRGGGRRGGNAGGQFGRPAAEQRQPVSSALLPRNPANLGRFMTSAEGGASLETRARHYLAVNCAHCHTINGGGNSAIEFDWLAPRERMRAIGEPAQHGDFGLADAKVIAPGAPERSVILSRVVMRGAGQMPPVGSRAPDPEGVRLLAEWIASLRE